MKPKTTAAPNKFYTLLKGTKAEFRLVCDRREYDKDAFIVVRYRRDRE